MMPTTDQKNSNVYSRLHNVPVNVRVINTKTQLAVVQSACVDYLRKTLTIKPYRGCDEGAICQQ
jgi:hypothetical protein